MEYYHSYVLTISLRLTRQIQQVAHGCRTPSSAKLLAASGLPYKDGDGKWRQATKVSKQELLRRAEHHRRGARKPLLWQPQPGDALPVRHRKGSEPDARGRCGGGS